MKTLKVKLKSVKLNDAGIMYLLPVMSKRFYKNKYTHVQIDGVVYNTSGNENITWLDEPLWSTW